MISILLIYLFVVNIAAFILYGVDKHRAVTHKWRISEAALLLFSFLGGGAGALIGMLFFHHKTRKWKFRILVPLSIAVWVFVTAFVIYTGQYYHAGDTAEKYVQKNINQTDLPVTMNDSAVTVTKQSGVYLFDGPGTDTAIVFYPGAKVQTEAYAPVLYLIAQEGYDCFLVDMPFHLAFFGMSRAGDVTESYPDYQHWYMAGHSLGGAMAGNYAAGHLDQFDGVIFLAAYPTKSLKKNGFKSLSLYGSEDGVLSRDHYKSSLSLMPDNFTEIIIEGGNHGQFGDYGYQKGDGKASISASQQWRQTAEDVEKFINQACTIQNSSQWYSSRHCNESHHTKTK